MTFFLFTVVGLGLSMVGGCLFFSRERYVVNILGADYANIIYRAEVRVCVGLNILCVDVVGESRKRFTLICLQSL